MTTERPMKRIGPKMEAARLYVLVHPGCTMHEVSKAIGPRGSSHYGYQTIHRAIEAGLVENRAPDGQSSQLHVVE